MSPSIRSVIAGFFLLLLVFRLLELLRPKALRLPVMRRGFWTDLAYWLFTPLATRVVTGASVVIVLVPVAYLIYGRIDRDLIDGVRMQKARRHVVGIVLLAGLFAEHAVEQLAVDRDGKRDRPGFAHGARGNGEVQDEFQARHIGYQEAQHRMVVDPAPGARTLRRHILHQVGVGVRIGHGKEVAQFPAPRHEQRGALHRRRKTLRLPRAGGAPTDCGQGEDAGSRHESRL